MNSIEKVVELLKKNAQEPDSGNEVEDSANRNHEKNLNSKIINKEVLKVDLEHLQNEGYITPDTLDSVKAEEFRIIKRPILQNAFGKGAVPVENGNIIMVTSSLPNEGKTYVSLSLAMSIALEMDKTVLLVDCDVINPSLSRLLDVNENVGLTNYLNDTNVMLGDIILNTSISRLRLLPSGSQYARSNELLTSSRMIDLVNELSERYTDRVVLFDSPPLLLANQAVVISQLVGQIIVVVEAEKTPQNVVVEAVGTLSEEKVIGIVLNKARKPSGHNYYGAYYGSPDN